LYINTWYCRKYNAIHTYCQYDTKSLFTLILLALPFKYYDEWLTNRGNTVTYTFVYIYIYPDIIDSLDNISTKYVMQTYMFYWFIRQIGKLRYAGDTLLLCICFIHLDLQYHYSLPDHLCDALLYPNKKFVWLSVIGWLLHRS